MPDLGVIPGPVYIPRCVAIRLKWRLANGKTAYNVLHGSYVSSPTFSQSQVNALFAQATTAFTGSGLASWLDTQTQLSSLGIRDMAQGSDGFGYGEWVSDTAGSDGGAAGPGGPLPPQIAFVVSLKTGRSGQANRGRVYIPGWHASADDGAGRITDASANDAVEFINTFRAAMSTAGFPIVIAHPARAAYTSPKPPFTEHPARPAGTIPVTSATKLDNVWDTQRLRSHV